MRRVERFVEIDAPVELVFEEFGDFEGMPRWMSGIGEVRRAGRRLTRWTTQSADVRGQRPLQWETELTVFQPDHRIAWQSVGGSEVETDGEAIFEETRRRTTIVRIVLGYNLPGVDPRAADAPLFDRRFDWVLEDDLTRFKHLVERRAQGAEREFDSERQRASPRAPIQPRGLRETFAKGERDPRSDERYYRETLNLRGREEDREGNERRVYAGGKEVRVNERPDYGDEELRRERAFNAALSAARESQLEGMRRYREEQRSNKRADSYWLEAERSRTSLSNPGRLPPSREQRREKRVEYAAAERPPQPYPLTPREREREREARQRDQRSGDGGLRRGVDRLLDEPPSGRWRR